MKRKNSLVSLGLMTTALCVLLIVFALLQTRKNTAPADNSATLPGSPELQNSSIFASYIPPYLYAAETTQNPQNYSLDEAMRVFRVIEKVQAESIQPPNGPFREISITESELNSYIAYRIDTEREEIMKELRLKLFDRNRIEGKIYLDLRGRDIPSFIRPELNFYFSADVVVSSGLVKIDVKELFLEDEPIQLQLLDMVMAIAAKLSGQEAVSLNDWYELPYGIKDIKTRKGLAIFYY